MRNFGIEIETCIQIGNKTNTWFENIKLYLNTIHANFKNTTNNILINWCNSFNNTIIICETQIINENENNIYYLFNFKTNTLLQLESNYIITYTYPYILQDFSVVCNDYHNNIIYPNNNPSNFNYNAKYSHNYKLTKNNYTINVEIVSHILKSFDEFKLFKLLLFPSDITFISNKSQGIHLNIDIHDLSLRYIKKIILEKYISWERKNARIIRPIKSDRYAREFNQDDIEKLRNINVREHLENTLIKYLSVHYKHQINVLEFRLFSPLGKDIDNKLIEVYNLFTNNKQKNITRKLNNRVY